MYKIDFALNNLQWLMCHKTKAKQSKANLVTIVRVQLFYCSQNPVLIILVSRFLLEFNSKRYVFLAENSTSN